MTFDTPPTTPPRSLEPARAPEILEAAFLCGAGAFFGVQGADLIITGLRLGTLTHHVVTWLIVVVGFCAFGVYWRGGRVLWPGWLRVLADEDLPGDDLPVVAATLPVRVALGLVLGAFLIAGLKPRVTTTGLAAGAERIAVLPFEIEGRSQGLGYLREGVADLLSHTLDGVNGVRVLDPTGVMRQWRGASPAERDRLALGPGFMRAASARSLLTGSLRESEGGLVIRATLRSVDGEELAQVEAEGPKERLARLIDEVSVALLRSVWRSREPLPEVDLTSITTSEAASLEAYLRGEAYLRRAQWGVAARSFREAISADSSFALSHARLATSLAWRTPGTAHDDPAVRASVAMVSRAPRRIPLRHRAPMRAWAMWDAGDVESARQALREHLATYGETRDSWHLLSEITFHEALRGHEDTQAFLDVADRVLELDPRFTPGFVHTLEVTLGRDRNGFFNYLQRAESSRFADAAVFRSLGEGLWDTPEERSASVQTAWAAYTDAVERVMAASYGVRAGDPEDFLEGLRGLVGTLPPGPDEQAWQGHTAILTSLGRLNAASDTSWARDVPRSTRDRALMLSPALAGYIDVVPDVVVDSLGARWQRAMVRMQMHLNRSEAAEARRWADSLESAALGEAASEDRIRGLAAGGRGWATLIDGDTAEAVGAMRAGLERAALWGEDKTRGASDAQVAELGRPMWFRLAATMATLPDTRDIGTDMLRDVQGLDRALGGPLDFHFAVLGHFELGRAYARAGRGVEARREFEWFLRLLENSDGGLAIEDEMAEARDALDRLAVG